MAPGDFDILKSVELKFFRLKQEHLDEVLEIERLSFPEPWSRGMFERELSLPISHFYVAKAENRIVGYGGYWHIEDEAHVINLAVHPASRARGFGRQILHFLLDRIAENGIIRRVLLEVRIGNSTARKLYEGAGFAATGVRPRYYHNEDALLMEKHLSRATRES